jgi:hypothetical protein
LQCCTDIAQVASLLKANPKYASELATACKAHDVKATEKLNSKYNLVLSSSIDVCPLAKSPGLSAYTECVQSCKTKFIKVKGN